MQLMGQDEDGEIKKKKKNLVMLSFFLLNVSFFFLSFPPFLPSFLVLITLIYGNAPGFIWDLYNYAHLF